MNKICINLGVVPSLFSVRKLASNLAAKNRVFSRFNDLFTHLKDVFKIGKVVVPGYLDELNKICINLEVVPSLFSVRKLASNLAAKNRIFSHFNDLFTHLKYVFEIGKVVVPRK